MSAGRRSVHPADTLCKYSLPAALTLHHDGHLAIRVETLHLDQLTAPCDVHEMPMQHLPISFPIEVALVDPHRLHSSAVRLREVKQHFQSTDLRLAPLDEVVFTRWARHPPIRGRRVSLHGHEAQSRQREK